MRHIISPNEELPVRKLWYGFADSDFDLCGNKWEPSGSPYLSKVGKKFDSALFLNGNSSLTSQITLPEAFTAEGWICPASLDGRFLSFHIDQNNCFELGFSGGKLAIFAKFNSSSWSQAVSNFAPTVNNIYHFLFYKNYGKYSNNKTGTNLTLTVNGSYNNQAFLQAQNFSFSSNKFNISFGFSKNTNSNFFSGAISEFRLSSGNRYNTAFGYAYSYTVPTSKFVKDSNTLALLHFDC